MIVYTAARLRGVEKSDAAKVASFIRIATTEGQVPGSGNGKLPGGFVPLVKSGATAKLWASAQQVAKLVEAQKEPAAQPTKAAPTKGAAPAAAAPGGVPVGAVAPADSPAAGPPAAAAPVADVETIATSANTSNQAQGLLPALLALLLAAGLGGPATRLVAEWRRRR
jgi:hypothetical protein